MVPWVCLSGEAIENICSTFIGRLHKYATRIRPSQGDGGIDMEETNADGTLTVYQIKKFATSLSSSQKKQIKDSWGQVLDTVSRRGKTLKEWHLVMPLDPTPENKVWFDGLVEGSGVHAVWDGLSKVEGWAAEMPEVVDYYVHDGYERIMGIVQTNLAALGISGTVDSNEIHRRLEAHARPSAY